VLISRSTNPEAGLMDRFFDGDGDRGESLYTICRPDEMPDATVFEFGEWEQKTTQEVGGHLGFAALRLKAATV
jgi:hypothetical protein